MTLSNDVLASVTGGTGNDFIVRPLPAGLEWRASRPVRDSDPDMSPRLLRRR
jgi:hypothetical protein